MRAAFLVFALALVGLGPAFAKPPAAYNKAAGKSAPMEIIEEDYTTEDGRLEKRQVEKKPTLDRWGNAQQNQYDLAVDGAFDGQTVAVLHFYTGMGFDFELPKKALKEKGFSVYRWIDRPPPAAELERQLQKASQLWIISGEYRQLGPDHLAVIKRFFESGKGVYIWGDNEPFYADANYVAEELLGASMHGYLQGEQTIGLQAREGRAGIMANHLVTTGIERIYEGHTVATISPSADMRPLMYGSADNLITAYYDKDGKRAILDGGFTRLYMKWDTAGTARFVKNAASWLVNAERFGDAVVAEAVRVKSVPATTTITKTVVTKKTAKPWLSVGWIALVLVGIMVGLLGVLMLPARIAMPRARLVMKRRKDS